MTTSGVATPPRPARPRSPRSEPEAVKRPFTPPPERSFDRVSRWALLLSLLVHLLVLLISPLFIQTENPPVGAAPTATGPRQEQGMEMVVVIPSADAPEFPAPTETPAEIPPTVVPPSSTQGVQPGDAAGQQEPGVDAAAPGPTTGDALQPGYRDRRLYVVPDELDPRARQSDEERYQEHLQARIDALNDSLGVAARRNATTSDWSVMDGSGNRWGLSPEGLHLGGVTVPRALLPLPGTSGDNQSIEADRERQRQREEIQRQADDADRAETRRERIEAMEAARGAREPSSGESSPE